MRMRWMNSLSAFLAFACSCAVYAGGEKMDDESWWMESAMVGRPERVSDALKKEDLLEKSEVKPAQKLLWQRYKKVATRLGWNRHLLPVPPAQQSNSNRPAQIKFSQLQADGMDMPYVFMRKGQKPEAGWPLFICLHGGGQYNQRDLAGPHGWSVNNSEWQAQMKLTRRVYKPDGLYFIPRMAHDRWGRWWMKHNIHIFTKMIKDAILFNEVDPNRVYIMGISQGGYGTCHLAPFLADQFAAAGAMAGGMMTVTENLRNLPFRSDIGEKDTMFDRINLAKKLHASLGSLKAKDPKGYENVLAIQKGRGHGIDYSLSPSWLEPHIRNPFPERVVWRCYAKDGIYRDHFYWVSLTEKPKSGEFEIVATLDKSANKVLVTAEEVQGRTGKEGEVVLRQPLTSSHVIVSLNDHMLDLDRPVTIELNGKTVFHGKVKRSRITMMQNLVKRGDINYAFPVNVELVN